MLKEIQIELISAEYVNNYADSLHVIDGHLCLHLEGDYWSLTLF